MNSYFKCRLPPQHFMTHHVNSKLMWVIIFNTVHFSLSFGTLYLIITYMQTFISKSLYLLTVLWDIWPAVYLGLNLFFWRQSVSPQWAGNLHVNYLCIYAFCFGMPHLISAFMWTLILKVTHFPTILLDVLPTIKMSFIMIMMTKMISTLM